MPAFALTWLSAAAAAPPRAQTNHSRQGKSYRATLKVEHTVLPAEAWQGPRVTVQEGDRTLVRQITRDSPVKDGHFERTRRTLTLLSDGREPAPWRKSSDFTPKWSPRKADALVSSKRLGPILIEDPGHPAGGSAKVRLFAPRASQVFLVLDDDPGARIRLTPDRAGVWEANLEKPPQKLYGQRYHFEVDGKAVADPYSHATDGDYGPSRFVNLHEHRFGDPGFDKGSVLEKLVRRGLLEVHVKDATAHPSSPVEDPAARGTYGGLRAQGVIDHYRSLGAGGLELMPVQEYDDHSGDGHTLNHWGYMTTFYFAPERRYAREARRAPSELQEAVDVLHQNGQSVLMDVVFNHTATGDELHFKALDKSYYFRARADGSPANGAGTGNELFTQRPMVRKLIIDSLRHFVNNYHIDGFRFDLGPLLDPQTMRAIDRALPKRIFLTAEPWAPQGDRALWRKGDLGTTRLTVWNDQFRNAAWRFLEGKADADTRFELMNSVAGSVRSNGRGWAERPTQALNYLESHDELTLADRLSGNKQRVFMGNVLLLTSQGIPMLGQGQEIMRTKQDGSGRAIANAHNMDNEVSWVDWGAKQRNRDLFEATSQLLALRAKLPQFHYARPLGEKDIRWLMPGNEKALGYVLPPPAGAHATETVAVLLNADPAERVTFQLPSPGKWKVVADGETLQVAPAGLRTAEGTYVVAPGTAVILSQLREGRP